MSFSKVSTSTMVQSSLEDGRDDFYEEVIVKTVILTLDSSGRFSTSKGLCDLF